ncbi:MAG TPA: hypothetical protein P5089_03170 [Candidatus Portnoybacteria bacterium]|nr:hypothetical protein [Candidatus Portnoybacteria bacterium]
MTKFINSVKNTLYLKLVNPRQFVAIVGIVGSILPSTITSAIPVALADEGVFDSSKAFLAVQPITLEEKDVNEIVLQDNLFVATVSNKNSVSVKEPVAKEATVAPSKAVIVTAYSSTADQTDSTPFITANGTRVQDGIIACNFLPFGTKVKFPEYSGDKVFTVTDRMAKKNSHKIDIWMPSRALAMEFGVQKLAYEIVQ